MTPHTPTARAATMAADSIREDEALKAIGRDALRKRIGPSQAKRLLAQAVQDTDLANRHLGIVVEVANG